MKKLGRFLLCMFLLAVCATTVHATDITVASFTFSGYTKSSAPRIRIYFSETFTDSNGIVVPGGSPQRGVVYKVVNTTLLAGVVTVPSFVVPSTRDGLDNRNSRMSVYVYDGNTLLQPNPLAPYTDLTVPSSITSSTGCSPSSRCGSLAEILNLQSGVPPLPSPQYYDAPTIDRLLATVAMGAPADSTYVTVLPVTALSNEFALSTLTNGLLKHTGGTPARAIPSTDYELPLTFSAPLARVVNTVSIPVATGSQNGYLSSADWTTFNNKQAALTLGNLTVGSGLTVSGGTGAIVGAGALVSLGGNVVTSVINDTNVTGSIATNALTLGFTGTLAKARQNAATVYNDQNNALGAFYQDIAQIAAPANPAAGTRRLFVDSGTGELSVRTSAGTTVSLEGSGGGGSGTVNAGVSGALAFYPANGTTVDDLTIGTANQIVGANSAASGHEYKTLAVGTAGTDFAIAHSANTVTFNLPDASAANRGVITTGTQTVAGNKTMSGQQFILTGNSQSFTWDNNNAEDLALSSNMGRAPVLLIPNYFFTSSSNARNVGLAIRPTIGSTTGGEAHFFSAFNAKIGHTSTPVPLGTKGMYSGYEANIDTAQALADLVANEAGHGYGATMVTRGGAPYSVLNGILTVNTTAVSSEPGVRGVNIALVNNVSGTLAYGFYAQQSGTQKATAGVKVTGNWDYLIDLKDGVGVTQAIRLANLGAVAARNAANTADVALFYLDASNQVQLGANLINDIPNPLWQLGSNATGWYTQKIDADGSWVLTKQGVGNAVTVSAARDVSATVSITTPIDYGGTAAGSTKTIRGTSNGSPVNAYILMNPVAGGTLPGTVGIGAPSTSFIAGDVLHLQGTDAAGSVLAIDAYGSGPNVTLRQAGGTAGTPTQTLADVNIGQISGRGFTDAAAFASGSRARVSFFAAENQTATAQGSYVKIETTPIGSTTIREIARFSNTGLFNPFKGADVASAATITATGNIFHVTGTTSITSVSGTGVQAGTVITIIFDAALTFTDGSNLRLAGNHPGGANSTITLQYDGSNWYELARSIN